ncbi:alpha/beta fold hydrolase [Streptomyces gilvosporeus]|uniref:Alpha/beta hydrolase n=1 Tax=Streptomyces gilvosporeus TaxID=553510 RepID=A0A1V0TSV2_9ACTN|nr:alpha/beta hydrolase [Streptomyces gilvosporeus]ARF56039.1 alpha/beta hydrolase [Streptomyces gilvosporeus]
MYVESHDGTRLAYEDYGQGETLVFVSSAMLNTEMWEYQLPFFAERGFRCVAFDRRGHGRSDRPSTGYDIDSTADDLAAVLTQLDLRDVTLVGHSLGGAEIARYLARHGAGRVARVVFIAAMLPFLKRTDDNPQGLPQEAIEASMARLRADRPKWLAGQKEAFFATHLGNDVSPALVEHTMAQCLSASPWATLQAQQAAVHTDSRAALREIDVPALVVHGAADFSAPVEVTGRRTAELIPGATYKEYPTAGHGIYASHHAQLNADVLEFIKR